MKKYVGICALLVGVVSPVLADDIGHGKPTSDPDATPPGTVTESCTSTVDCALQELIELFTESREM